MFHSLGETNCAVLLGFVQRLTDTSPIVDQKTTVDHDFDFTTVVTRATLGTIIEDTEFALGIVDGNHCIDWVIVTRNWLANV